MKRLMVLAAAVGIVVAACGSTGGDATVDATAQSAAVQAVSTTTTTVPDTTTTSTTQPPTTTTTVPDGIQTSRVIAGEDADVDAIVEAYSVVFDSTTTFEEKAAYLTDATGLEDTIVKYAAAGDDVGGIKLQADRVGIDGTDALVIYSFLFAGNTAYSDLEGEAVLTDSGWQIPREFFCQIMVLSRVGCP